jgi:hypothetical protein
MDRPRDRSQRYSPGAIYELYHQGRWKKAVAEIDALLENPDSLEDHTIHILRRWRENWAAANDPDYEPPPNTSAGRCGPLERQIRDARRRGDYQAALRDSWRLIQRCAPGTVGFSTALAKLADSAALSGDLVLARRVVETYLSHNALLAAALQNEATPVVYHWHSEEDLPRKGPDALNALEFGMPLEAGIIGIQNDEAPCWVELLEAVVERYLFTFHRQYRNAVYALQQYYQGRGDAGSARRIRAIARRRIAEANERLRDHRAREQGQEGDESGEE